MSQRKADDYVEVELELAELDATSAEIKATYGSITKLMGFRIPHIINSAHINEF